jgi:hypothetical protein
VGGFRHIAPMVGLDMTDAPDPNELVETPWGTCERWRAQSLYTGSIQSLQNQYQILNDSIAEANKHAAAKEEAYLAVVQHVCDSLARETIRFDSFVQRRRLARRKAEHAKARADEARKAASIKQALDALEEHEHRGELTVHEPSENEDREQLRASQDQGDLPEDLRTGPAAQDPEELQSREPTVRNPVAVSLNEDD